MKKLIVVVNDLERSRKSTLARALSYHLHAEEVKHLLVTSNEVDMTDSFQGEFWDLEDQFDVSQLISAIDENEAVIMDVHSGAARNWAEIFESEDLENVLAEIDAEMTLVIPYLGTERCNEEIYDLAELFTDQADYVVAHVTGARQGELKWKGSPGEKAIRYLEASEVDIPELPRELQTALDSADINLIDALNQPADLPRFAEVQVMQWLDRISSALANSDEHLIPTVSRSLSLDY